MCQLRQFKRYIIQLIFVVSCISSITLADQTPKELSSKDIEKFITSIAAIQHFYVKDINNTDLFNDAIKGMVSSLDPHSSFLDKKALEELKIVSSGEFAGIGIEILPDNGFLKVISPLSGSPADKAGIKAGDIIFKVNEKIIDNISLQESISMIRGKIGTTVKLTILRKDAEKPLVFNVKRDNIKIENIKYKMLNPGYGYIQITFFGKPIKKKVTQAIKALQKKSNGRLKGLVLDVRNNPGGLLDSAVDISDLFLSDNKLDKYKKLIVYTKGRSKGSNMKITAKAKNIIPGTPMIVLINQGSASASEIVAGALQDYNRAVIMGQRSFGKGSVQTILPINKNNAIKLTTALYYTPSGRSIQAEGIEPDIIVPELKLDIDKNNIEKQVLFRIMEKDLNDHLKAKSKSKDRKRSIKKLHEKNMLLANKDYQLYSALMMLKGMHALND